MGIWDVFQSAAEAVHRQTPDLNDAYRTMYGIGVAAAFAGGGAIRNRAAQGGDILHYAGEKVRQSVSGLAPVASTAVSRLDYVRRSASGLAPAAASAVFTIEQAVRVDRIKEAMADPEVRRSIGQFALNVADYAVEEATKPYIGGLYRIGRDNLTKAGSRRGASTGPLTKELQEMRELVGDAGAGGAHGGQDRAHRGGIMFSAAAVAEFLPLAAGVLGAKSGGRPKGVHDEGIQRRGFRGRSSGPTSGKGEERTAVRFYAEILA